MNLDLEVSSIMETLSIKVNENPFVGLRSFEADEGHLFFGRDAQIKELLQKLYTGHFLAVIGSSGCGKSSLIRAGLIPKLKGGFLAQKRDRWLIATMRPSGSPLQCFASSLYDSIKETDELQVKSFFKQLSPDYLLKVGATEFINQLKSHFIHSRFNLFILVDQFEELFTYKTNSENEKNENIFFVNLLLSLANEPELPVYTAITMRSDYIGHCNRFFGLPELLNVSQYLVPRLKWQQVREVIEFPIKLYGNQINAGLLDLLTNDSDKDLDQLPILQHCLMRTYDNWMADGSKGCIDFRHYEKTGKLNGAICKHANEIFNTLDDKQKKITEYLFKAITEFNADYEPIRKPAKFGIIVNICEAVNGASKEDVRRVLDIFRKKSCAFLTPSETITNITDETIIDVSHESLLRQWDLLKDDKLKGSARDGWMVGEQRSADKLYWLSELTKAEHKEYLGKLGIADAEKWHKKQNPNTAWAGRYVPNLKDIEAFIAKSKIKTRRKDFIFNGAISLSVIAVILLIFFTAKAKVNSAVLKANQAETQRQKDSAMLRAANAEAQRVKDLAQIKEAQSEAQRQKDLAQIKEAQAEAQTQKDLAQIKEAQSEAQRQKDLAQIQKIQKHLTDSFLTTTADSIVTLANSPFYKSNHFSPIEKSNYIDSLVAYKYVNLDQVRYSNLLSVLNTKGRIYQIADSDPNEAFREAMLLYKNPGDTLGRSIAYDLANNYLFYMQDTLLNKRTTGSRLAALSKNGNLLAIKLNDTIKIFSTKNDALLPQRNIALHSNIYGDSETYSFTETNDAKNSMSFVGDDSLFVLVNDRVYKTSLITGKVTPPSVTPGLNKAAYDSLLNKLFNYDKYYVSSVSPDGKKIGIDYDDYYVKILNTVADTTKLEQLRVNSIFGYITGIDFSYNNNTIIAKQLYGCTVFHRMSQSDSFSAAKRPYTYAAFTPDKQYLIVQPETTPIFELHKLEPDTIISTINFAELNIDTLKNSEVTSILLSPDWKKLFIRARKTNDGRYRTYYFKRNNSDSIFPFKKISNTGVKLIPVNYINTSNVFLNDDNLISFNSYFTDSIWVWKKYEDVSSDVQLQKLAERISNIERTDSVSKSALNKITSSYDTKILKPQYEKLADSSPDNYTYLSTYRDYSSLYFVYYADTTERIRDLKKIASHEENLLKDDSADIILKHDLSSDYWNLSWLLVFKRSFDSVKSCARRGLSLYPSNDGINTNLALGYLLSGECDKADSVYSRYKGKTYLTDNRNFTDEFRNDLEQLEDAGIITPKNEETYKHVEAVRKFLNGDISVLNCHTH